jgi:hypothetical protein
MASLQEQSPRTSERGSDAYIDYLCGKMVDLDPERIVGFVRQFCREIVVRPLLISGMLTTMPPKPGVPLERAFGILVDVGLESNREIAVTLCHELLHIVLLVLALPAEEHDEAMIERSARALADRFPEVARYFEEAAPGLALSFPLRLQAVSTR